MITPSPSVQANDATPSIVIVGLGPGSLSDLTTAATAALRAGYPIFLRTSHHPTIAAFSSPEGQALLGNLHWQSFDNLYEHATSFPQLYQEIVSQLIQTAKQKSPIIYAVPGHPMVGEQTVQLLIQQAPAQGVNLNVIPGLSSIDAVCQALGTDVLDSLQVADALTLADPLSQPRFPSPWAPLLILQLHSRAVASQVKLSLLDRYPPDHQVTLVVHAAVPGEEQILPIPLVELDRQTLPDHLSSLWVPSLPPLQPLSALRTLEEVVHQLRAPDGCPWDREQTHASLRKYLVEETYEFLDALESGDEQAQAEELGDILFQIMFHAEIAHEEHTYDLGSVIESITAKLIRRHPHVFGSVTVRDSNDVLHNWSKIKAAEHQGQHSPFSGLPRSLPALTLAEAIWQRAAGLGFHPPDTATALARVQTELQALSAATTPTLQRETLGNLLVAIIAVSNAMRIDAEDALRQAAQQLASHLSQYIQSQTSTPSGAREEAPRLLDIWSAPTRPTVSPIKHG